MNKNIVIAEPSNIMDGYCFKTEESEKIDESTLLTFAIDLSMNDSSFTSHEKSEFTPIYQKNEWTVWYPEDGISVGEPYDIFNTVFFGGKEDGVKSTVKAIDLEKDVSSPSGHRYRICFRFRHWVFYKIIHSSTTH